VTSGSTPAAGRYVDQLYRSIGIPTHLAPNIKVAEASKAIENAQRDLNISFANELALLFDKLDIDTNDVMEAAGTKWNFLKFKAGLVGGHCISVDPYYLIHKAEEVGYHPQVIASGRRVNDYMPIFVANKLIKTMMKYGDMKKNPSVLVLGVTFKENVPDVRNTKVVDVVRELEDFGATVDVFDPHADQHELNYEYGLNILDDESLLFGKKYDGIILAVAHREFKYLNLEPHTTEDTIIYDLKNFLPRSVVDIRL
jgi:UDP-N-acetyl-D-galactosamine dehydrogenase